MSDNEKLIAEVRALCAAATPGPWLVVVGEPPGEDVAIPRSFVGSCKVTWKGL